MQSIDFSHKVVEMVGITKKFGDFTANENINLTVHRGEVHALLGENGAGKTTLVNMLYGLLRPTSGSIKINGSPVVVSGPNVAIKSGVGMVHQHFMLIEPFGAFVGAAVAYFSGSPWLGLLCAALGGGFWGLIHAIACVSFAAEQIVSGIAINFLGAGTALFISRLLFDGSTQALTVTNKIPQPLSFLFGEGKLFATAGFMDLVFNRFATVYLAFFMVFLVWFVLYRTRLGLRVQAVGENPEAVNSLGIDVIRIRYGAVIMSGFFAGLGGAAMSIAVVSRFSSTLISGHGFIALAAMIFGKWKPQGALVACLLFGAAKGLEIFLGSKGVPISGDILAMFPYVLTLIILVGFVGKTVAPAADGKIFIKGDS